MALSSTNGGAYGTAKSISVNSTNPSDVFSGFAIVGNIASAIAAAKTALCAIGRNGADPTVIVVAVPTNTAADVDAIQFSNSSGASFDAGEIRVYGVK